ncbi:hypothetical protein [Wolbachia endosymbiont (group A) of Agelastica alni]|uniref:hypothetical protein n=1 Tax=Wolbachia endosymbiont (group A) of Agelastica alni TaxID=3066130 RepID=UPI003340556A
MQQSPLGSRNFVDCMIWKTLFKSHWISVSHIQLYEYCDLKAISTGKPVLRHWDPASHATSSKMLCFNIRLATFLLTNLINFLDPSGLCCIAPYAVVIYDKFM